MGQQKQEAEQAADQAEDESQAGSLQAEGEDERLPQPEPAPNTSPSIRRELTGHKVNPANDLLTVTVLDGPGAGGACHEYEIRLPDGSGLRLAFQNGPIAENGVNGITHEALLAILIDRLECFQAGQFANTYNQAALQYLQMAQGELQARTKERTARGVEGTHQQ